MSSCSDNASGNTILTAAAALAIALSQGKTADEIGVLGSFFTVLGDSLELLASCSPSACESGQPAGQE